MQLGVCRSRTARDTTHRTAHLRNVQLAPGVTMSADGRTMRLPSRCGARMGPVPRRLPDSQPWPRAHVVPGDARRGQRGADARGESPIGSITMSRGYLGTCSLMINARTWSASRDHHLPAHMRSSSTAGDRHRALARGGVPLDPRLVVDRSAFDRIIAAGIYSAPTAVPRWQSHPGTEG